jgi:hypothetical protein
MTVTGVYVNVVAFDVKHTTAPVRDNVKKLSGLMESGIVTFLVKVLSAVVLGL